MLDNAFFWLYFTILFSTAFLVRGVLSFFRKRGLRGALVYAVLALASLSIFWLLLKDLSFSSSVNLWIFLLSACIPGGLAALYSPLLLLVPAAALGVSVFWQIPIGDIRSSSEQHLGQLVFYPAQEGSIYFEWTDRVGFHSDKLEGDRLAVIIEKEELPEYLFFLDSSVTVLGFTTSGGDLFPLPDQVNPTFSALEKDGQKSSRSLKILKKKYPGLIFQRPGFFNTYTYTLSGSGEVLIMEGKTRF